MQNSLSTTANKEVVLTDQEEMFIQALLENGGNTRDAARQANYNQDYGYVVRKRLARPIAEAAHEYIAMHSVKAAKKLVDTVDAEVPNPIHLAAAQAVLDRTAKQFLVKEEVEGPTIKANIFILPEKRELKAIDVEFKEI